MATRSWNTVLNLAGDTEFRAWAQGVIDMLKASNLVQTSDTGQLADPVVAARPAVSTAAGYWIFRMNDAKQADFPIYMKIEVGVGSNQAIMQMWVTIGTGTDGAGAITGVRLARTICGRSTSGATLALTYEHAASWGEGYFGFWHGVNVNYGNFFVVERNRDVDGATKDDVAWALFSGPGSSQGSWGTLAKPPVAAALMTTGTTQHGFPCLFSPGSPVSEVTSKDGDVPVFPFEPFFGRRQPPLLGACVANAADVGSGVVFTTVMYGATRTFRRVSDGAASYIVRGASAILPSSNAALCLRWE